MYILIAIILIVVLGIILTGVYSVFKTKINFFVTGLDAKFSIADLTLLWNVAKICKLENPTSLFFSMAALSRCMSEITRKANIDGTENTEKMQTLLSKLFNYRTKLQNESDQKKGIDNTKGLDRGQKLRIILPGKGVFVSEVLNNGSDLVISVPRQKDLIPISAEDWEGKVINVYLWRNGDARYVFDTTVVGHGLFIGESALSLKHSNNLIRTQKRKSVRAKCNIKAQLFIIKEEIVDYDVIQTQGGYKCLLEDISESGSLIRIGGKGVSNVQVCLQFTIQSTMIAMYGVVRTAEYNEQTNQSLLHFECIHIQQNMKNTVLSYVYNTMSEEEKEVYDAMTLTDADQKNDEESGDSSQIVDVTQPLDAREEISNDLEINKEKEETVDLPSLEEVSDSVSVFDNYSPKVE